MGAATHLDRSYEEMLEAFSETDAQRLRVELMQLCAYVLLTWIPSLDNQPRAP